MKQIVALGGGGFSMERSPKLDRYILSLARRARPRVCFVPTASGDSRDYIRRFHLAFRKLRCVPSDLCLFRPPKDLAAFVRAQDVVYVGGGNTHNMLLLWREWGLDRLLRAAWARGTVMAGISAGAICWFEQGVTDSFGLPLRPMNALGWLPGSHCPHYDGERDRRPMYRRLVRAGRLLPGYAADDGAALHFVGHRLDRVVSSRPGARAWRVEKSAEVEIVPERL